LKAELTEKLNQRGYTEGFMFQAKDLQNYDGNFPSSVWEFCGQVISSERLKDGTYDLKIKAHNTLLASDELEIVGPSYQTGLLSAGSLRDFKTGAAMIEAHGGGGSQVVLLNSKQDWPERSVLRRRL